ncbi:uncharacterized protein VICG_01194, partial [Vittaforma corneae ATCC 50505]
VKHNSQWIDHEESIMIFDVDYCLYENAELRAAESAFINTRERELFGDSEMTFKQLKKKHGSMKIGLMKDYGMTIEQIKQNDFMDTCKFLKPDDELKGLLESIPLKKYCLTNGFGEKIKSILEALGINECFEKIYCSNDENIEEDWILKPKESAFKFLMNDLGIDPGKVISKQFKIYYFDDLLENVMAAKELGWDARKVTKESAIHDALRKFITEKFGSSPLLLNTMTSRPSELSVADVQN